MVEQNRKLAARRHGTKRISFACISCRLVFIALLMTCCSAQKVILEGKVAPPRPPLVSLSVDFGGVVQVIELREGDDASNVATAFGLQHSLPQESIQQIKEELELRLLLQAPIQPDREEEGGVVAALTASLLQHERKAAAAAAEGDKQADEAKLGTTNGDRATPDMAAEDEISAKGKTAETKIDGQPTGAVQQAQPPTTEEAGAGTYDIEAVRALALTLRAEAEAAYSPEDPDAFYVDLELNGIPAPLVFRRSRLRSVEEEVSEAADAYLAPLKLGEGAEKNKEFVMEKIMKAIQDQDFPPVAPPTNVSEIAAEFQRRALEAYSEEDPQLYFVDLRINNESAPIVYQKADGEIDQVAREYCLAVGSEDKDHIAFVEREIRLAIRNKDDQLLQAANAKKTPAKENKQEAPKKTAAKEKKQEAPKKTAAKENKQEAPKKTAAKEKIQEAPSKKKKRTKEEPQASTPSNTTVSVEGWTDWKLKLKFKTQSAFARVKRAASSSGVLQWQTYLIGAVLMLVGLGFSKARDEGRKVSKRRNLHLPSGVPKPSPLSSRVRRTCMHVYHSTIAFATSTTTSISARLGRSPPDPSSCSSPSIAAVSDGKTGKEKGVGKGSEEESKEANGRAANGKPSQEKENSGRRQPATGEGNGGGGDGDATTDRDSGEESEGQVKRVRFEAGKADPAGAVAVAGVAQEFSWEGFLSKHCGGGTPGPSSSATSTPTFYAMCALSGVGAVLARTEGFDMEIHEACDWVRLAKNKKADIVVGGQRYLVMMREGGFLFVSSKETGVKIMSAKTKTGFLLGMFRDASKGDAKDVLTSMVEALAKLKR